MSAKPRVTCRDIFTLALPDTDTDTDTEIEVELPYLPSETMHYVDYVIARPNPSTLIVGYLADDRDCPHPLNDCDGMGKIYSARRHASKADRAAMQAALELTSDWEPDLAGYYEEARAHFREVDYHHEPTDKQMDDKMLEIWKATRDPYVFLLDCYDHSGQHWSFAGGGAQCQWDTVAGAGVWVPDASCREYIESFPEAERKVEARKCAKSALEEFNKWLAGDCYGVVTAVYTGSEGVFTLVREDACWGHIGSEYAMTEVRSNVETIKLSHEAT